MTVPLPSLLDRQVLKNNTAPKETKPPLWSRQVRASGDQRYSSSRNNVIVIVSETSDAPQKVEHQAATCSLSENEITFFLSWADHSCCFLKFWVSLVSSATDACSPLCRPDTHSINPPQKAAENRTQEFT